MRTQSASSAHTLEDPRFKPVRARRGNGGRFRTMFKLVLEALRDARVAEADYRLQIGRGVDPAEAAARAFRRNAPGL